MPSKVSPARVPSRVRKAPAERRQQIADAACEIARTQGLSAVTLRAIAAEAGVASGLVAHYAPSMDDLVAETFSRIVAGELAELEALVRTRAAPLERIRVLLDTLLDGSREDVTLVWVHSWALGGRNEVLAAAVRTQMDAWEDFLEQLVLDGVDAGVFTADDARAVACQMLGMIDGLNAHALVRWRDDTQRRGLIGLSVEAMLGLPRGSLAPL